MRNNFRQLGEAMPHSAYFEASSRYLVDPEKIKYVFPPLLVFSTNKN